MRATTAKQRSQKRKKSSSSISESGESMVSTQTSPPKPVGKHHTIQAEKTSDAETTTNSKQFRNFDNQKHFRL